MNTVHVVRPAGVDDPARPSGGNVYDRRVCDGLSALGWTVHEHAALPAYLPEGAVVLVDGLIASVAPELVAAATRLRLVVLVHQPLGPGVPTERAVFEAAAVVVTTSRWTRRRLLEWYDLDPERVHVAEPGADAAELAPGTPDGGSLVCVGAVTPLKGYDVLVAALASLSDLAWTCRGVGSLEIDPEFADGLDDTVELTGPLTRSELDSVYASADLLVLASRAETYGMVVTEALAHGVPVVATDVGGVHEALGRRSGVLVPPDDPEALADALRHWLTDEEHRRVLRTAARERRETLVDWRRTSALVAGALTEAAS